MKTRGLTACRGYLQAGDWEGAAGVVQETVRRGVALRGKTACLQAVEALSQTGRDDALLALMMLLARSKECSLASSCTWLIFASTQPRAATALLNLMRSRGLEPDGATYLAVLSVCRRAKQPDAAQRVFSSIPIARDVSMYTALIGAYASRGRAEKAWKLLSEMLAKGPRPNIRTFKSVLFACLTAKNAQLALQAIEEMWRCGIDTSAPGRDVVPYELVLGACVGAGAKSEALEFISRVCTRHPEYRQALYQHLIKESTFANQPGASLSYVEASLAAGVVPTAASFHTAIGACRVQGRASDCLWLLDKAVEVGVRLETASFALALDACKQSAAWQEALAVLYSMERHGVAPDHKAYTAAIAACGRAGECKEAEALLQEMVRRGLQPDLVTYNAVLNGLAKVGAWDRALAMVDAMARKGVQPDLISYNTVLDACYRAKHWHAGRDILKAMQQRGVQPDVVSYSSAIAACWATNRWDDLCELLGEMEARGISQEDVVFGMAMDAGKETNPKGVLELLKRMKENGLRPNIKCYGAVLYALAHPGAWTVAEQIIAEMQADGVTPDAGCYHSLILAYQKAGRLEEALAVIPRILQDDSCIVDHKLAGLAFSIYARAQRQADALALVDRFIALAGPNQAAGLTSMLGHCRLWGEWDLMGDLLLRADAAGVRLGEKALQRASLSCPPEKPGLKHKILSYLGERQPQARPKEVFA
jgi:pentatricopeptide repeat domain-containing protein 1